MFFYSFKYGYLSTRLFFCSPGMEVYPVRPSFLESIPKSLFAGVVGGLCFLCVAIILSFGTACYMRKRRSYKHRKRRQGKCCVNCSLLTAFLGCIQTAGKSDIHTVFSKFLNWIWFCLHRATLVTHLIGCWSIDVGVECVISTSDCSTCCNTCIGASAPLC